MKLTDLSAALVSECLSLESEKINLTERGSIFPLPGKKYLLKVDMPFLVYDGTISGNVGLVNIHGVYLGSLLRPNEMVLAAVAEVGEHHIVHVIAEAARRLSDLARKKARKLRTERKRLIRIGKALKVLSKGKLPKDKKP